MDTLLAVPNDDFDNAVRCFREGDHNTAANLFAKIVAADPAHYESVRHLGLIAHKIGSHEQAAELIAQAILLNPNSADAFADLATVLRALGRQQYALRALETAIAMGQRTARAFTDLGDLLKELGRHDDAARAYRSACEPMTDGAECLPSAAPQVLERQPIPEHWRRVTLVVIEPDGYPHAAGLADLVTSFRHALAELGIDAQVVRNKVSGQGMNLVFGAHLIGTRAIADGLPPNTVLVNLEQLRGNKLEAGSIYADLMSRFPVWDHSQRNIAELRALTKNPHVHRIGIGFAPGMQSIAPVTEQPTDVLFYGSLNDRRRAILSALQQAGLQVRHLFGVYGVERDRAIAEAKVVLNIHFYEDSIHEIVRTSYLLANRKAVVCECNADTEIDADMRRALVAVPYDNLVAACIELVKDDARRRNAEQAGFQVFSQRRQAAMLARAIAETSPPLPRVINLGSGKSWSPNYLNIDIDPKWGPDLLADISNPQWLGKTFISRRFGVQRLSTESFDAIVTMDVLEHVIDLPAFMTSCLGLLQYGGKMLINVPYDLSYGAWQDPTHVRAFNERSWLYYTDWHWYLGWTEARFDVQSIEMVLSPLGQKLAPSMPAADLHRQPRAVDSMKVVLVKRRLSDDERAAARNFLGGIDRAVAGA